MARLSQAAVLSLLSASMAAILLWYALKSPEGDEAAKQKSYVEKDLLDDGDGMSEDEGEEDGGESEDTETASNLRGIGSKDAETDGGAPMMAQTTKESAATSPLDAPMDDEEATKKSLHSRIESIDKRGKALFKSKKYMEAAEAFTEALDLIDSSQPDKATSSALSKQVITLMNNRSAMYEKGGLPDLSLADCDSVLDLDPSHTKARTRKLRVLESEGRHGDALVEVCAIQLKFMQENREKLKMGIQVKPPVPQSKIEDLMGNIVPGEIDIYMEKIKAENKGRGLPSNHTIVQLLQSFTGFNKWMKEAAKDGSVRSITADIAALGPEGEGDNGVKKVELLLKRGRRHAYERSFLKAKEDFEAAYALAGEGGDPVINALVDVDTLARLLEWTGMSRHLGYDLVGASKCYEKCSELEPQNAEVLVKRAGVKMDGGDHDAASKLFEEALALDPDNPDALLHRANLKMLLGVPADAKKDLKRCIELRPDHVMARLRLATVLMAAEDMDGASKALDAVQEIDPESSESHSYRGEMYFAKQDFAGAREEFNKAIELNADNPTPYVNAALAVMNTPSAGGFGPPDVNEAKSLLEKAVEVDPQFQAAYVHLGQLKLIAATDLQTARDVVALYDKGLQYCHAAEEIKDILSMRILTMAQIDAAKSLKMETLSMQ